MIAAPAPDESDMEYQDGFDAGYKGDDPQNILSSMYMKGYEEGKDAYDLEEEKYYNEFDDPDHEPFLERFENWSEPNPLFDYGDRE